MEPVWLVEAGEPIAWIGGAIHQHAQHASSPPLQLHPMGEALSGPTGVAVRST